MEFTPVSKELRGATQPYLIDYNVTRQQFAWDEISAALDWLPEGQGLNIAYEAIDRHVLHGRGHDIALRWLSKNEDVIDFTYSDMMVQTNRFANVLRRLGIGRGDRVFVLAGRVPELYIAALGTLKNTSVLCPLFSAFGPEPIQQRLQRGDGKLLLTTTALYQKKVRQIVENLPQLKHIVLLDAEEHQGDCLWSLNQLMAEANVQFEIPPTDPEDMALLHFTSGTTGMPKGAVHVHQAVFTHYMTGKYVFDLHPDDVFWCTADPGWVTGTSYGIITPFVHGVTNVIDEAEFDAERWYRILQDQKVTVWYTAPTAIRRLMRLDFNPLEHYDLSQLRLVYSVGEPLNPEAVVWGETTLGLPIHDSWWQTETGGVMISNFAAMDIRPGSMGKPVPGITAGIVRKVADDQVEIIDQPDVDGILALKPGWPSMFRAYLHDKERYDKCFVDGWYLSGDLATQDADGYFWFVGRADDIIKTSGHMVGPFEVESALIEHPAVAEAGVIGVPNPMIGELVKAFVALKPGYEPSKKLELELIGFARKKLGPAVAPKQIAFEKNLPKTRSGKIMRRLLKARELGLPEGDISTLETD